MSETLVKAITTLLKFGFQCVPTTRDAAKKYGITHGGATSNFPSLAMRIKGTITNDEGNLKISQKPFDHGRA